MKYCCRCMNTMGDNDEVCPRCGMEQRVYAAPPHILSVGTVVNGRYLIGGIIGEGGFGITYIGLDTLLKYRVAVKEFYPNGMVTRNCSVSTDVQTIRSGNSQDFFYKARENFLREAQTLALFNEEPSIVSVKDFFAANNTVYIVMEYLEGITLKRHLSQLGGRMPWRGAVELLMPVLTALKKIHAKGLIHRDISPDNIMLVKGSVKILDFGAAREYTDEKSLSVMLKHGYAPFEQYKRHGNQGAWTDIYTFCATLYKCVTGETPLQATDRMDEDTLKMPSELGIEVGKVFEDVLRRGLAVRVKERIQTDDELLAGLQAALADTETIAGKTQYADDDGEITVDAETDDGIQTAPVTEDVTHNVPPSQPVVPVVTKQVETPGPVIENVSEPPGPPAAVPEKKKNMTVIAAAVGIAIVGGGVFALSKLNSPAAVKEQPAAVTSAEITSAATAKTSSAETTTTTTTTAATTTTTTTTTTTAAKAETAAETTAATSKKRSKTASAKDEASEPEEVASVDPYISLASKNENLFFGDSMYVEYYSEPFDQEVVLSCSDSNIAHIDGNSVTALGNAGSCVITATMYYEGKSYSDSMTLSVKGISFSMKEDSANIYRDAMEINYMYDTGHFDFDYGYPSWSLEGAVNGDIEWQIVRGSGYMDGARLHITQPGTVKVRGTISRNGYSASAAYSVNFTLGWTVTTKSGNDRDFFTEPNGSLIDTVPVGSYLEFTETKTALTDGVSKIYGKTSYNGKSGWVEIGKFI